MPSLHPAACFRLHGRTLNHNIACTKTVTIAPQLWEHPPHGSIHGKYYQKVDNQADNQEGQCLHSVGTVTQLTKVLSYQESDSF